MRLLDTYAVNCGAKIDKPYLYETYFPLPMEKFITFQAQSKFESKDYSYWQDVIDMINPTLIKNNISIVQMGGIKELPFQRVVDIRGRTNMNQLGYVIKRSLLHFGPDSLCVHIASSYNVPIVSLYSASMPEIAGPHFGDPSKHVLFKGYERVKNKKPSYANKEDPKSIDTIKPEEIAKEILRLLGFDTFIPVETVFTGKKYSNKYLREMIPNALGEISNPEQPLELRFDLHSDENILGHQLNYLHKGIVVTDRPINSLLLKYFKKKIQVLVFRVGQNDYPEFVKEVIGLGIPVLIVSELPQEEIQKRKIKYYEFGIINKIPEPDKEVIEKLRPDLDRLYYRSCKIIASNDKVYSSHASIEPDIEMKNDYEYQKVIDSPKFWQDMEFYTIVKKLDEPTKVA